MSYVHVIRLCLVSDRGSLLQAEAWHLIWEAKILLQNRNQPSNQELRPIELCQGAPLNPWMPFPEYVMYRLMPGMGESEESTLSSPLMKFPAINCLQVKCEIPASSIEVCMLLLSSDCCPQFLPWTVGVELQNRSPRAAVEIPGRIFGNKMWAFLFSSGIYSDGEYMRWYFLHHDPFLVIFSHDGECQPPLEICVFQSHFRQMVSIWPCFAWEAFPRHIYSLPPYL